MNDRQENKLSMCRTVLLIQLDPVWQPLIATVPALANGFTQLAYLIDPLEIETEGQSTSKKKVKGAALDKKARKLALVTAILAVCGPLHALGANLGDNEMQAVAKATPSELKAMRDDLLTSRANSIHVLAAANAAALVPYGVPAPALTTLADTRDAWAAGTQVPRSHVVATTAATVNIGAAFTAIDALFKNVLDQLILPFQASNPSFYTVYKASRVIVDTKAKKKTPAPTPP